MRATPRKETEMAAVSVLTRCFFNSARASSVPVSYTHLLRHQGDDGGFHSLVHQEGDALQDSIAEVLGKRCFAVDQGMKSPVISLVPQMNEVSYDHAIATYADVYKRQAFAVAPTRHVPL